MMDRLKKREEKKRLWIDELLKKEDVPSQLPLKYRALSVIFRDANNHDLLEINNILQEEMRRRSVSITVALKITPQTISRLDIDIEREIKKRAIVKYIKKHYKHLNKEQRTNILSRLVSEGALQPKVPSESSSSGGTFGLDFDDDDISSDEFSIDEDNFLSKIFKQETGLSRNEYRMLIRDVFRHDGRQFDDFKRYLDRYEDPEELARIVQDLNERGINTPNVMLYAFDLPLGKTYRIVWDEKYGQYPIIMDE